MNTLSVMDPRIILYLLCAPAGVHHMQEHTHIQTHIMVGKLVYGVASAEQ